MEVVLDMSTLTTEFALMYVLLDHTPQSRKPASLVEMGTIGMAATASSSVLSVRVSMFKTTNVSVQ